MSIESSNINVQPHDDPTRSGLTLDSICCERGDRLLIQDLSLHIADGQGVRIEGPNGSGKTTLLRVIAGLSQQYDGQVRWNGEDIRQNASSLATECLYIGHLAGVKALLTPLENLSWWLSLHIPSAKPISQEVQLQALQSVGLDRFADTPCHQLSAGQQRRIALARLYLSEHRLWVLDEPFTAIDAAGVVLLEQRIAEHLEQGGMAIVTTHQAMNIPGFTSHSLAATSANGAIS